MSAMTRNQRWRLASLLLLVIVACSALFPRRAHATYDDPVVVSLGDSYSSGEGCPPFYGENDDSRFYGQTVESCDWLAHRSEWSWSGQLSFDDGYTMMRDKKGYRWFFFADSGAVAYHIYGTDEPAYHEKTPKDHDTVSLEPQLVSSEKALEQAGLSGEKVDYVTLTIGGNDIGFSAVVTEKLLVPSSICRTFTADTISLAWAKYYAQARENILNAYTAILSHFPNAHVLVVGYPKLMNEKKAITAFAELSQGDMLGFLRNLVLEFIQEHSVGFSDWEAYRVNTNVSKFNNELKGLVESLNNPKISFVSVESEFAGHELGADDAFINRIQLRNWNDVEASLISAYSVHPNSCNKEYDGTAERDGTVDCGIHAYVHAVQARINELRAQADRSNEPNDQAVDPNPTPQEDPAPSAKARDVALVLDVSGSMAGDPLAATKEAAKSFVDIATGNEAQVGVAAFSDDARLVASVGTSGNTTKIAIDDLVDEGGTNMEAGLAQGYGMLGANAANKRIIVLMSDGEPNDGRTGEDLIAYAQSIRDANGDGKEEVKIYTLGFNESSDGQYLLANIASPGCHYEVQDSGDLEAFFADIADEINGTRFIYARVACPVDVSVSLNGETLSSAGNGLQTRTSFGSLSFEEELDESEDGNNSVKVLRLREGESYDISIAGYDSGVMNYSIGFLDAEGDYTDFRTFSGIEISQSTLIHTTAEVSGTTQMDIDDDGDGSIDRRLRAGANEEAQLVNNGWVVRLVFAGFALLGVLVVAAVLLRVLVLNK